MVCVIVYRKLVQSPGNTGSDKSTENVCETEELNFQFDDYGGKKYNFSEPPPAG